MIKESQQPGTGEFLGGTKAVPHLNRATDKLISPRAFHTVNAEIRTADADGIFRCPGAGRIVFGGDKAVPWIEWRGDRGSQVNIAETEDQVAGFENNPFDLVDTLKPVDAPDEFDVARAPGGIGPDRFHINANRLQRALILPREGKVDDACWNDHVINRREGFLQGLQVRQEIFQWQDGAIEVDLKRADARRDVDNARYGLTLESV